MASSRAVSPSTRYTAGPATTWAAALASSATVSARARTTCSRGWEALSRVDAASPNRVHRRGDLRPAAAGQDQQDRIVRRGAQGLAQPVGIGLGHVLGQGGIADRGDLQARLLEPGRVERQDRQQVVDRARQSPGPGGSGSPHLGPDIFDQFQSGVLAAQALGDAQGEPPGIDQHGRVRLLARGQGRGLVGARLTTREEPSAFGPASKDRQVGQLALQPLPPCAPPTPTKRIASPSRRQRPASAQRRARRPTPRPPPA